MKNTHLRVGIAVLLLHFFLLGSAAAQSNTNGFVAKKPPGSTLGSELVM